MKNIIKTLVVVMVIVLTLAVFTACNQDPEPTTPACEHSGGTATCEQKAVCEKCQQPYGELAEHTIVTQSGKPATCESAGSTDGKYCSECFEVLEVQEEIKALGHVDAENDGNHVCDREGCGKEGITECAAGEKSHNCAECNASLTECKAAEGSHKCAICDAVKSEHNYDNDCDTTCNTCGETREVEDHSYDNTCDTTCNKCGATREIEHTYDNTCDTTCNVCSDIREITHTTEVVKGSDATCTETGLTDGEQCTVCKTWTEPQQVIPVKGHTDVDPFDYKCDNCGDDLCTEHTPVEIPAVPATCTTTGLTAGTKCSKCGDTIMAQEVTNALDHSWVVKYEWSADNSYCVATKYCTNDNTHVEVTEKAIVKTVTLNVTAEKVTYTYAVEFTNAEFEAQTKTVEGEVTLENSIATINAPAVTGRVASHDYVKFPFYDTTATHTFTIYYSEVDVWDGTSVSESLSGSGTEEDPYLIQSGADLAYIASVTNTTNDGGSNAFVGVYFKLTKSIDLNSHELHIGTGNNWGNGFGGYIEGNNCTIRNINNQYPLIGGMYYGWIKNLSLYGKVESERNGVAALVSYALSTTLHNVTNYATISGINIVGGIVSTLEQNGNTSNNLVNYGSVTGTGWQVGGIIGKLGGYLNDSTNWGSVTGGGDANVGGIAGSSQDKDSWKGTITKGANYGALTNNGNAIGHIIGTANLITLVDCYENHSLTHYDAVDAGCETDGNVEYWYCSVCHKNLDAEGNVITDVVTKATGHSLDTGVVADGKITFTCQNEGCNYTETKEANLYVVTVNHLYTDCSVAAEAEKLTFNYNTINTINAKTIEGYVASHDYVKVHVLADTTVTIYYSKIDVWDGTVATAFASGDGTENNPFIIETGAQLAYLAQLANENTSAAGDLYGTGVYYKLGASIDLTQHTWTPIAMWDTAGKWTYFDGNFDGANHKIIINMSAEVNGYGLFACLGGSAVVKNLTLYGSITALHRVGALAFRTLNGAYIEYVTNYATVTATSDDGSTSNLTYVGGLIGYLAGSTSTIKNCVNYGTVVSKTGKICGGVVGSAEGTIDSCINYGSVTSGNGRFGGVCGQTAAAKVKNCVNYGTVAGTGYGAGIVGYATSSTAITACTNYGEVTATDSGSYVGGVAGQNGAASVISECVNYGSVTGLKHTGGIIGQLKGTLQACENYGTISGTASYVGGINGSTNGTDYVITDCTDHTATAE